MGKTTTYFRQTHSGENCVFGVFNIFLRDVWDHCETEADKKILCEKACRWDKDAVS